MFTRVLLWAIAGVIALFIYTFIVYALGSDVALPTRDYTDMPGNLHWGAVPFPDQRPQTVYICPDGSSNTTSHADCPQVQQPQVVFQEPQVSFNQPVSEPAVAQAPARAGGATDVLSGSVPVNAGDCVHFDARSTAVNAPHTIVNPKIGDEDRHVLVTGPGQYEGIYDATFYWGAGSQCH
jgi:hypothetical protein